MKISTTQPEACLKEELCSRSASSRRIQNDKYFVCLRKSLSLAHAHSRGSGGSDFSLDAFKKRGNRKGDEGIVRKKGERGC